MQYKTIIFDLDGTLLNTLVDLYNSVNHAMRDCSFPERTIDEVRRFVGNGVRTLIRRAAPKNITEEQYKAAYDAFEDHYAVHNRDNTAPYDGVVDMLKELRSRGHKLAIVSNKIDFAVQDLKHEFFDDVVDCAVGDREGIAIKPEPDMVYIAMKELGAELSECVYVGDTDVDLATAENSGMPCISVSWGFRSRAELESYNAETIVDDPAEIIAIV